MKERKDWTDPFTRRGFLTYSLSTASVIGVVEGTDYLTDQVDPLETEDAVGGEFERRYGAEEGDLLYEERYDLNDDGLIDETDRELAEDSGNFAL